MTPRQRRMTLVLGIVAGVSIAGALALSAFRQNVTFFFDPTQVASGEVRGRRALPARRHGDRQGSVHRAPGSLEVRFVVTDFSHEVPVSYTGVLPDLFREGAGVVAHGRLRGDGTFVADEVLAKHDEKYMPPEVARSLKRRHGESARRTAARGRAVPARPGGSLKPMLPELGHFALILALLLAALQAFFGIAGPVLGRDRWIAAVIPAVAGQFVMVATAVGCLIAAFVGNDFSVRLCRREFQLRAAAVLPRDGAVGRARGLAAAVDLAARRVDGGGGDRLGAPAAALRGARARACSAW